MRLLDARTKQFKEFFNVIPPYAILSHTWRSDELTFKHIEQNGYVPSQKIDGCCGQALKDGLYYVWIDTICIDKSSSAELSEAINSMWNWYHQSNVCYAYLSDVSLCTNMEEIKPPFSTSRWFSRGWTLQELIAPEMVRFYNESWVLLGTKTGSSQDYNFTKLLSRVAQIDVQVLRDRDTLGTFSIAQRMSWAAHRTTTRVEDVAYSLLGLFGINMPLLYGEGTRAFHRLQEEILKASSDETIFAWKLPSVGTWSHPRASLFANSPLDYASCRLMVPSTPQSFKPSHYSLTNQGLLIETNICPLPINGGAVLARLNCVEAANGRCLAIPLIQSSENDMMFSRYCRIPSPLLIPSHLFDEQRRENIYIHRSIGHKESQYRSGIIVLLRGDIVGYKILEFYPQTWSEIMSPGLRFWHQSKNTLSGHQDILFRVDREGTPTFAIWLDLKFAFSTISGLDPQQLKCYVALLHPENTLAELVLLKGGIKEALGWKDACSGFFLGRQLLNCKIKIQDKLERKITYVSIEVTAPDWAEK